MISKIIINKISSSDVIVYRRVSTKKQLKQEYRNQLDDIRSAYRDFSIAHSCIDNITEQVSGLADPEIRMASGLGKALRLLQRNPLAVVLVSKADRIARRADIFELIQRQGLGHRIFDASTGLCLDDLIEAGDHVVVQRKTEMKLASSRDGIRRRQAAGGVMGSPNIGKWSKKAAAKTKQLAEDRRSEVLSVISRMVIEARGKMPPYGDICDKVNKRGLRTGQRRPYTPKRLSQSRKSNPAAWEHACDSYHRPRRRIRQLVTEALAEARAAAEARSKARAAVEVLSHQDRLLDMKLPSRTANRVMRLIEVGYTTAQVVNDASLGIYDLRQKQTGCDGCRGPPRI